MLFLYYKKLEGEDIMKKPMKLIAIALSATLLTACGGKSGSGKAVDNKTEAASSSVITMSEAKEAELSATSTVADGVDGTEMSDIEKNSANQAKGTVTDNVYQNSYFGVKLAIPEGFQQTDYTGFDLMAVSSTNGSMYQVQVIGTGLAGVNGNIATQESIIEASKSYIEQMMQSAGYTDSNVTTEKGTFLGEEANLLVVNAKMEGMSLYMIDAILLKDGQLGQFFTASLQSKEEALELLKAYEKI